MYNYEIPTEILERYNIDYDEFLLLLLVSRGRDLQKLKESLLYKDTVRENKFGVLYTKRRERIIVECILSDYKRYLKDMKKSGVTNIWVQSAYRSIEYQTDLFNNKINYFMLLGNTREEAEKLTLQTINRPGTSEHNLGLAVDFNYVNNDFEKTEEFKWLQKNAENYGFILRYKQEKEDITKVDYEPWHWRYVGVENAKKMNELDMCLEEYIDYLKNI